MLLLLLDTVQALQPQLVISCLIWIFLTFIFTMSFSFLITRTYVAGNGNMDDGAPRLSGVDVDRLVVDPSRYSPSTLHDRSSKFSRVLIESFDQSNMHFFCFYFFDDAKTFMQQSYYFTQMSQFIFHCIIMHCF